jgi:hypothetical protein
VNITGKASLLILSSITWLILLLALSCQAKRESSALPTPILGDSLVRKATPIKPDSATPPVLDTISIFKQVLKNKDKGYHYENDSIEIKYGHIFSKKQKHLFIKLNNEAEYGVEFRIYALKGNVFSLIAHFIESFNTFDGYCLLDVNNDAHNDFLLAWHPANITSCSKLCDVYLLKHDALHFTKVENSFCEPIFYPQKKLVRGKEYGYGYTYYKVKWNNNYTVDTIEMVYSKYAKELGADFLNDSTHYNKVDYTQNKEIILLDDLPSEYLNHEKERVLQKALFKK